MSGWEVKQSCNSEEGKKLNWLCLETGRNKCCNGILENLEGWKEVR